MSNVIHVVDYGVGNLYSVARAIEKVGGTARLTADAADIARADRLLLPGVGAFRDGMAGLKRTGVVDAIAAVAQAGRPLLGICLGMQMLATQSSEYGEHAGLNIIPGRVEAMPPINALGLRRKVPFIGWSNLESAARGFDGTILNGMTSDDSVYLVHSFQFLPDDADDLLASYRYEDARITAVVARDNVVGCQFHPEKSGRVGLRMIERFLMA